MCCVIIYGRLKKKVISFDRVAVLISSVAIFVHFFEFVK
jgi:hypothetical protein